MKQPRRMSRGLARSHYKLQAFDMGDNMIVVTFTYGVKEVQLFNPFQRNTLNKVVSSLYSYSGPYYGYGALLNLLDAKMGKLKDLCKFLIIGIPLNKALYTTGYLLVDVCGWRFIAFVFEWMGKHSLSIFILVTSNLVVIVVQGFYWKSPHNNIIY
ncbi:hypothetical protein L2E82_01248 [Cichorium intybus]|uniref:Uncharacterized protein n=1 Tax=Cichorium intybus TaxID=13427 RepID=A0ACB9GZU5_CICIN|nr:hypothetical protein L2E82_01248 [Cichorium intybus]